MVMRSRRRSRSRRSNRRRGEERQRSRVRSRRRMETRGKSKRRSKKGKMEGDSYRSNLDGLIRETEAMRRQIHGMGRPISRSRSSSPSLSRSQKPRVVQGRRVSASPVSSPRVASPRVSTPRSTSPRPSTPRSTSPSFPGKRVPIGRPSSVERPSSATRSKSPGAMQSRSRAPSRSRVSTSPVTPQTSRLSTSPRTPSSMKKGRRRSVVEDLPGIDARTMAQYYNSLSAKERSEKGLPTSSRFKSTFTKDQKQKILRAYNEQWKSEHPLGALSTPVHEAFAKARRVVNMGEPGSTPGMKVAIPGRTGKEQKYRRDGGYDTLGTVPPLTEAERQGLMKVARKNKLPMMEEKKGGASRSKSLAHTTDGSEFSDDFSDVLLEKVYYYSETYRDWLHAELIVDDDDVKMKILIPDSEPRYIFGNLKDSSFKQRIKGKIYKKEKRSYKLHEIEEKLKK